MTRKRERREQPFYQDGYSPERQIRHHTHTVRKSATMRTSPLQPSSWLPAVAGTHTPHQPTIHTHLPPVRPTGKPTPVIRRHSLLSINDSVGCDCYDRAVTAGVANCSGGPGSWGGHTASLGPFTSAVGGIIGDTLFPGGRDLASSWSPVGARSVAILDVQFRGETPTSPGY
jgi:hypothetical protein